MPCSCVSRHMEGWRYASIGPFNGHSIRTWIASYKWCPDAFRLMSVYAVQASSSTTTQKRCKHKLSVVCWGNLVVDVLLFCELKPEIYAFHSHFFGYPLVEADGRFRIDCAVPEKFRSIRALDCRPLWRHSHPHFAMRTIIIISRVFDRLLFGCYCASFKD